MGKISAQANHLQAQAIKELIDTEKSYYNGLIAFQEVYIKPLMKSNPGLDNKAYEKLKIFFIRLEAMLTISNELQKHSAFSKESPSAEDIAQCFIKHHKLFELLKEYILEYENTFNIAKQNIKFHKKCQILSENPKAFKKNISDYAITPIQRIVRYSLLLKELLKHLSQESQKQEYEAVKEALLSIESVIKNVNQRDLSESPEFCNAIKKIPVTDEITSPNSTRIFCKQYEKQAKLYEEVSGTKLNQSSEKALANSIWKQTKELKRNLIPIPNPNFNTPKKQEIVKSPPKTVIYPSSSTQLFSEQSNVKKIHEYYTSQTNRSCEQCNPTTLKVKINLQLAYYIKQDSNDSKKLIYETIFSNNQIDNKKIIIAACEDAADAAIKNGTKPIFDISNSAMSIPIKKLIYETFKDKLETLKIKGEPPFTIMPIMSKELICELEKKITKRNKKKR